MVKLKYLHITCKEFNEKEIIFYCCIGVKSYQHGNGGSLEIELSE